MTDWPGLFSAMMDQLKSQATVRNRFKQNRFQVNTFSKIIIMKTVEMRRRPLQNVQQETKGNNNDILMTLLYLYRLRMALYVQGQLYRSVIVWAPVVRTSQSASIAHFNCLHVNCTKMCCTCTVLLCTFATS